MKLKKLKIGKKKDSSKPRRKFKIDLSVIIFIAIIAIVGFIVFYLTIGQRGNKYGDRLRGIDKISFTKKDKSKFTDALSNNERVNKASIDIQGRLIYVIVDVKGDVSVGDAQAILNDSLANLSDEVKGYYDINALVTKSEEATPEEGQTKEFPISGYKKKTSSGLVWRNY